MDRTTRVTDYRFIKEANGALTITNVMLEDDGKWQCEAENTRQYTLNARPVKLVVLDRPKPPYLLIDSRRLDAGNIFVPVKENSELNLACVSEGGNPKPTLTWEVLLSPGVDRHAQKVSVEDMELEEIKNEKDKNTYKINSGAKSEARLKAVYRTHHNARILCVMEHPTLKIRQNASLLLDVQYTPSFAISRTPGFGYPLREGIEVSLKCDVDSNPPSTPRWQKDDGEPPVPQTGDGFLNFTSIRREHSGWYKCTSRHLNFQYSSIGYYLSVRYDSVDVTSEPDDQDMSVAASSHNPNKGQLEVQLGGAVTLQCPQGSLGCWSHLDPVTARLRGLGHGLSTPTGQFSLKDVVYQDAGTYKCIGQSPMNKKKLEVLQTVAVTVKADMQTDALS
uniref:Ig-like domain-containing protein n=1 Tax=Glossina brevipalpis TaxID=37001 RepID=A0A1A9WIW1_9MUSC